MGAGLGSFACCQAWRIRKHDKSARSHCMNCDYQLKWYDNIPILSWLMLGGKCRKCRKSIGVAEIAAEVGLAAVFALSYAFWPRKAGLEARDVFAIIGFGRKVEGNADCYIAGELCGWNCLLGIAFDRGNFARFIHDGYFMERAWRHDYFAGLLLLYV